MKPFFTGLLAILICFTMTACTNANDNTKYNVFCWNELNPSETSISKKYTANPITIDGDNFIIEGTGEYLLCGDPSWTSKEMNAVAKSAEACGFKGIVYDIEKWDDLESLSQAYEGLSTVLEVHASIPYWLDLEQAERIIKSVDCIELMVYLKDQEKELAEPILKLAQKHSTQINIVYELQSPNEIWGVKEINTYNCDVEAAKENYKQNFENRAGLSIHGLY